MTARNQNLPKWVEIEAEKKRKPRAAKPKAEPESKLHVKVNLSGFVEFDLEGDEAAGLTGMLNRLELDEILDFVDPWASAAELRYDVEVSNWGTSEHWEANETTGTIESRVPWIPEEWFKR